MLRLRVSITSAKGLGDTGLDVLLQHRLAHLAKRAAGGSNLREHMHTVFFSVDHAADGSDLPLCPSEARQQATFFVFSEVHLLNYTPQGY